ncbi:MAG: glucokinase [Syntrophus sp. (in: bacteria)]|nr:glucokinase [Syntrophus sp. (in: bacteria)]
MNMETKGKSNVLLGGDIGGTHTRLGLFSPQTDPHSPLVVKTFPSKEFPDLAGIIAAFLRQTGARPDMACLGVAGPVLNGEARLTHLPWMLSEERLMHDFGFRQVRLVNDVLAAAWAVPHLRPEDLSVLNAGFPDPKGPRAVVAPGTGLGEAFLVRIGEEDCAYPTEGGHVDFAPTGPEERLLLESLLNPGKPVDFELVCSGPGIFRIYQFYRDVLLQEEPPWLAERLRQVEDPVPVIVEAALDRTMPSRLCRAAVERFVSILGAKAGNTALEILPEGGLYLAGGIVPRMLNLLREGPFMDAFRRKRYMTELLSRIPVYAVVHPAPALLGAAVFCRKAVGNGSL